MAKKTKEQEPMENIIKALKNKIAVQEDDIEHLEVTLANCKQRCEQLAKDYDKLRQEYATHLITTIKIVRY